MLLLRGTARTEILDGVAAEYVAGAAKSTEGDELAAFEAAVRGPYKAANEAVFSWERTDPLSSCQLVTVQRAPTSVLRRLKNS